MSEKLMLCYIPCKEECFKCHNKYEIMYRKDKEKNPSVTDYYICDDCVRGDLEKENAELKKRNRVLEKYPYKAVIEDRGSVLIETPYNMWFCPKEFYDEITREKEELKSLLLDCEEAFTFVESKGECPYCRMQDRNELEHKDECILKRVRAVVERKL